MLSPLVVDVLRDQLLRVLSGHDDPAPTFRWGVVIHRREERGRLRFGAVTPTGESLLLSAPLLEQLRRFPCWLDGAVPIRLETRQLSEADGWLDAATRSARPRLVDSIAVYFDPDASPGEAGGFKQMAGVLTPATIPADLFVLTRERPSGWPL